MKLIIQTTERVPNEIGDEHRYCTVTPTQLEAIKKIVECEHECAVAGGKVYCKKCGETMEWEYDKKEDWPEELDNKEFWGTDLNRVVQNLNFLLRKVKELDERK